MKEKQALESKFLMEVRNQVSGKGFHCRGNADTPGHFNAESHGFSCLSQSLDHFLLRIDANESNGNIIESVRMNKHL